MYRHLVNEIYHTVANSGAQHQPKACTSYNVYTGSIHRVPNNNNNNNNNNNKNCSQMRINANSCISDITRK